MLKLYYFMLVFQNTSNQVCLDIYKRPKSYKNIMFYLSLFGYKRVLCIAYFQIVYESNYIEKISFFNCRDISKSEFWFKL